MPELRGPDMDRPDRPAPCPAEPVGPPTRPAPRVRAIDRIRADSERTLANWAVRVADLPAFRAVPALDLAGLQDGVPALMATVLDAALLGDPAVDPDPRGRVAAAAAEHGRVRGAADFPIGALLAEYQALRAEIRAATERVARADAALGEAARDLQGHLGAVLDAAVIHAAEAWASVGRESSAVRGPSVGVDRAR